MLQDASGRGWCVMCLRAELTRLKAHAAIAHDNLLACGWDDLARSVERRVSMLDLNILARERVPFDLGDEIEEANRPPPTSAERQ